MEMASVQRSKGQCNLLRKLTWSSGLYAAKTDDAFIESGCTNWKNATTQKRL